MAIISPLTYTIANGQAVDATPLMADLNQIVSNVNANAAAVAGNASQEFLVATTTNSAGAVPLAQAQSQFAPIAITGSWTPTIGSATGAFTTVSAAGNYVQLGKLFCFTVSVTITTNGTAAGYVSATFPAGVVPSYLQLCAGRAVAVSGKSLTGTVQTGLTIFNYDNTYPGADGENLVITGSIMIN